MDSESLCDELMVLKNRIVRCMMEEYSQISENIGEEWSPLPDLNRGPADFSGCIGFSSENTLQSAALASLS